MKIEDIKTENTKLKLEVARLERELKACDEALSELTEYAKKILEPYKDVNPKTPLELREQRKRSGVVVPFRKKEDEIYV